MPPEASHRGKTRENTPQLRAIAECTGEARLKDEPPSTALVRGRLERDLHRKFMPHPPVSKGEPCVCGMRQRIAAQAASGPARGRRQHLMPTCRATTPALRLCTSTCPKPAVFII